MRKYSQFLSPRTTCDLETQQALSTAPALHKGQQCFLIAGIHARSISHGMAENNARCDSPFWPWRL